MKFILGTRGSQLSIAQTNWIVSELKKKNPEHEFEIVTIKTKGDTDARPLFTIDQKGIFEKEIDKAVADKQIDFAVHSLKDVPSTLMENLVLGCVPAREDVNDVLITNSGHTLQTIPANSVVGTSSLRRAVQISRIRKDLTVKSIRGNIETRIKKVQDGNYDGIVLAQAGIRRLGINVKHSKLSTSDFPPSPGQGAIGIVCRSDDSNTQKMLRTIEDEDTRTAVEAERALSTFVDSGCRFPVGAYGQVIGTSMNLTVVAYSIDGEKAITVQKTGSRSDPHALGKAAAEELQQKGVQELAANWREKLEEWNR
ncbi:hydroxymethylbilane synthase [Candidatus Nitrosotenuis cloacae]|uniref:hydroxymethylbilane synthase n=1 Tax=Candidatus Nitrosotenuis cloacae TaxID=1603555 RepID=UPI00227E5075|nr:hydroxymethylbilane synthase [Candidatus Nitrosotenuis cloacae]